jgi:transposase-like protein
VPSNYSTPACPYKGCSATSQHIVSIGFSRPVACLKGARRQRFRCNCCHRNFSDNTLKLSFRLKHHDPALNSKIFAYCLMGLSNRKISRILVISEHLVRIRLHRMAQQALSFHHQCSAHISIHEALAFDGLENFALSQYEPNNIQQAIGRNSLFIYDFNFASLNRKGRMSVWQKQKLQDICKTQGRFNPRNIRIATVDILKRLAARAPQKHKKPTPKQSGEISQLSSFQRLTLLSDEHFQYRRALSRDLAPKLFEHITVSSKACRNYQNILFAVNHADLLIRQNVAAFARETISFSKTQGRMCQRFALFLIHKNYMSSQFTKKQIRRPKAHEQSPAQFLGLTDRLLKFADIFTWRSLPHQSKLLNEDWQYFWRAEVPPKYHRSLLFK